MFENDLWHIRTDILLQVSYGTVYKKRPEYPAGSTASLLLTRFNHSLMTKAAINPIPETRI